MIRTGCIALLLSMAFATAIDAQEIVALNKHIQRFGDPAENPGGLIEQISGNLWQEVLLLPLPQGEDKREEIARILVFSRGDLQTGATSGASGSTSAVVSPLLPAIFGIGFENGAITRTVSGTTITLKANPAGLACVAKADGATAVALRDREACNTFWTRLGVTASFDTSRGGETTALENIETLKSRFAELGVRYEVLNRRDVTLEGVSGTAGPFREHAMKLADLVGRLDGDPAMAKAKSAVERDLKALTESPAWDGTTSEVRQKQVEDIVRKIASGTKIADDLAADARTVWRQTLEAYDRLEESIAGALVVTADYSLQRPDLAAEDLAGGIVPKGTRPPDVHVGRLVLAKAPLANLDLTSNLSVSLFGEKRGGMTSLLRDIRLGVEGKFKLRAVNSYGRPTLSFAGLYTYLHQSPLGLGVTAFNGADIAGEGHIGVFQTKLEFPAANNGMRIPLSLTVSNRTELIKESEVRGQIGISFNLDSLFAAD